MTVRVDLVVEVDRAKWNEIYGEPDDGAAVIREGVCDFSAQAVRDTLAAADGAITKVDRRV